MYIKNIRLVEYKNLDFSCELAKGINYIIAPNGTGKTNFLESIYYLSTGGSFRRGSEDNVLPIGKSVDFSSAEALLVSKKSNTQEENLLKMVWTPENEKSFLINGKRITPGKFKNRLRALVHAPTTIDVITGSASNRRDLLDITSKHLSGSGEKVYSRYRKILAHKNKLLQRVKYYGQPTITYETKTQLDFWNQELIDAGSTIATERYILVESLLPIMSDIAEQIYNLPEYKISYKIKSNYLHLSEEEKIQDKATLHKTALDSLTRSLIEGAETELISKKAIIGPHRDDIKFELNDVNVRHSASRGQQRLFSLILLFAILTLIEAEIEEPVVLLLDDVLSELDPTHKTNTLRYLSSLCKTSFDSSGKLDRQIIITSPDKKDIPSNIYSKIGKANHIIIPNQNKKQVKRK